MQSDVPGWSGRSLLVPLLLWGGILIVLMGLAYLLWKRSVLANVERLAIAQPEPPQEPVSEGAIDLPSPDDLQAAFEEGVAHVRAGQTEAGIARLREVVAVTPANDEAWFWLAVAAVKQRSYRTAERCFLQAKRYGHPEADKALDWLRKQM